MSQLAALALSLTIFGLGACARDASREVAAPARSGPDRVKPFVHIPDTVSRQAAGFLKTYSDPAALPAWPAADDFAGWKRQWQAGEERMKPFVKAALERYEPSVSERKVGGVAVLDIKPKGWKDNGKLLIYTHGGAHTFFSARSTLPISAMTADATGLRVLSIDYTVSPAGKWQKVTDEVLAVFAALRKEGRQLKDIAIFGDSAGGALAAGSVLKMRDQGLGCRPRSSSGRRGLTSPTAGIPPSR